jgi:hypothetical protein
MTNTNYTKLTAGVIVAWFIFALSASALHVFENNASRIGVSVAIAATVPIVMFALWIAFSEPFRKFVFSLNPQILTLAQSWRIIGFIFVLLEARGALPSVFARPAGYGDMAIGMTATFVAWRLTRPGYRNSFIAWQFLGIIDLMAAVGLGTTASLLSPQAPTMAPLTMLPLSLVPTFLVPLFLIFHGICIAQARAWKATPTDVARRGAYRAA